MPIKKPTAIPDFEGELATVTAEINATYGDRTIRRAAVLPRFTHIPTGIFALDMALFGGLAEMTASQVVGWESSGKTTLSYKQCAEAQRKYSDDVVAWVDTDNMFDPAYAKMLGVDLERVALIQPDSGEMAVDSAVALAGCKEVVLVILDCIASLVPQKIIDESVVDAQVAVVARLTGKLCSKIQNAFMAERKRGHVFSFLSVNQFRFKVGVVFGDPRILPGGVQQNYFHMTRLEMKNKPKLTKNDLGQESVYENNYSFTVQKSKVGATIKHGEFTMSADPAHPAGMFKLLEFDTLRDYGKRMGFVQGDKKLSIPEWRIERPTQALLEEALAADEKMALWLKQKCIAAARERQQLPPFPRDGYLCGLRVSPPAKPVQGHAPLATKKPKLAPRAR